MIKRLLAKILFGIAISLDKALDKLDAKARKRSEVKPKTLRRTPLKAPKRIKIKPDDYEANNIGKIADGRQFFLTCPFVPGTKSAPGTEYVACYIFAAAGEFISAQIDALGVRGSGTAEKRVMIVEERLKALGKTRRQSIKIVPFSIIKNDVEFGLIARPPEDPNDAEDHWWIEAQPGNYMAFYPPWDGDYDT